jgi:cytochrome c553
LKGIGPIPPIAGRSPTYIGRQLYEFQHSGRTGSASALMKQTVEKLSQDDMIALAGTSVRSSHKRDRQRQTP